MKVSMKILWWIPAVLIMVMIFKFSCDDGKQSGSLSRDVSTNLVTVSNDLFKLKMSDAEIEKKSSDIEFYIRKAAHMTEYMLLSFTVILGFTKGCKVVDWRRYVFSEIWVFVYASTDEIHQLFVLDRSGKFTDVLIDAAGGALAVLIVYAIHRIRIRRCK